MVDPVISIQIVNIDYYQLKYDKLYSFSDYKNISLPVVRIFGSTPIGQRCCVHIHGALPYLYFRPENLLDTTFDVEDHVYSYLSNIERLIEDGIKALKPSETETYHRKIIQKLEVVKKIPLYGYHSNAKPFVKVSVRHPTDVKKVVAVLETEFLGRRMQPYEAHIPYILQVMQDYALFGMGWVHLSEAKFRSSGPDSSVMEEDYGDGLELNLSSEQAADESNMAGVAGYQPPPPPPQFTSSSLNPNSSTVKNAVDYQLSKYQRLDDISRRSEERPGTAGITGAARSSGIISTVLNAQTSHLPMTPLHQQTSAESTVQKESPSAPKARLFPSPIDEPDSGLGTTLRDIIYSSSTDEDDSVPMQLLDETKTSVQERALNRGNISFSNDGGEHGDGGCECLARAGDTVASVTVQDIERSLSLDLQSETPVIDPPQTAVIPGLVTGSLPVLDVSSQEVHQLLLRQPLVSIPQEEDSNASPLDKISCCELEIDVHVSHILNRHDLVSDTAVHEPGDPLSQSHGRLAYVKSLAELWEEERNRCAAKGEELLPPVSAPFTNTSHRAPEVTELQFQKRLESLLAKGRALERAKETLSQRLSQETSSVQEADDGNGGRPLEVQASPPKSQSDEDILSQWVQQRIEDKAAAMEEGLASSRRNLFGASHSQLESDMCPLLSAPDLPPSLSPDTLLSRHLSLERSDPARFDSLKKEGMLVREGDDDDEQDDIEIESEVQAIESSTQHESMIDSPHLGREFKSLNEPPPVELKSDQQQLVETDDIEDLFQEKVLGRQGLSPAYETKMSRSIYTPSSLLTAQAAPTTNELVLKSKGPTRSRGKGKSASVPMYTAFGGPSIKTQKNLEISKDRVAESISLQGQEALQILSDDSSSVALPSNDFVQNRSPFLERDPVHRLSGSPSLMDAAKSEILFSPTVPIKRKRNVFENTIQTGRNILVPAFCPPGRQNLKPLHTYGIPNLLAKAPFFSDLSDCKPDTIGRPLQNSRYVMARYADGRPLYEEFGRANDDLTHPRVGQTSSSCSLKRAIRVIVEKELLEENEVRRLCGIPLVKERKVHISGARRALAPTFNPPSVKAVIPLLQDASAEDEFMRKRKRLRSQIETPTQTQAPAALMGMKVDRPQAVEKAQVTDRNDSKLRRNVSVMSIEVFSMTRRDLLPNPKHDAVHCVVWALEKDSDASADSLSDDERENQEFPQSRHFGVAVLLPPVDDSRKNDVASADTEKERYNATNEVRMTLLASGLVDQGAEVHVLRSERDLFRCVIKVIRGSDPDFILGYDVQRGSLGYLIERGRHLQPPISVLQLISRAPEEDPSSKNEFDKYGQENESGIWITGRTVLNLWRRMQAELKLDRYTISSVTAHVLGLRYPCFTSEQLTRWFTSPLTRHRVIKYILTAADLSLRLIDKLDLIRRTAEFARVYGIDFFSVLSRGSQYRVEAVMLRVAHSLGFIAISPSRRQVASQPAMEVIPLVMEPRSKFYEDPVIVLDFQSLYPSMMLAYNICVSTCLGKLRTGETVASHKPQGVYSPAASSPATTEDDTRGVLGVCTWPEELAASAALEHVEKTGSRPFITPNGSVFCSKEVRHGILPLMLKEILDTRVMIKKAMKRWKGDGASGAVLSRVLDARQLALKLLANVTYGYTSAGFSGRMPMAEVADAIVQSGRSTLEWTIREVNRNTSWQAEVVYGDTDSVFVLLRGRTKEDAFQIGEEIANYITSRSPHDVVLKMEKVYSPCILVTKKRYVGFAYETRDQKIPHFDAKGIEAVRRDQCPATIKIQEKALRILFESSDMSKVKAYLITQWNKLHMGWDKVHVRDFIFSKEVRLGHYSVDENGDPKAQPPGAIVVCKAMAKDPCAEPPYRWRVPYLVIYGPPKTPLKDLVVAPEELLRRGSMMRINHLYYITKCINPALDRVFSLCGVDVPLWYRNTPKPTTRLRRPLRELMYSEHDTNRANLRNAQLTTGQQKLDSFFRMDTCDICGGESRRSLCEECMRQPGISLASLMWRLQGLCKKDQALESICFNCSKHHQYAAIHESGHLVSKDGCSSLDCPLFFERCRLVTKLGELYFSEEEIQKQISFINSDC